MEQAKLDLEEAEVNLEGTTLVTPINGTVMSLDMSVGDTVGTTAVLTVADLSQQYLEVFLDESDFQVSAFPVYHRGVDCFGFLFQEKSRRPLCREKLML